MSGTAAQRLKIDDIQRAAVKQLDSESRAMLGQFMTPSSVADFMASLFKQWPTEVHLLEPGAGVGSLVDSFTSQFVSKAPAGSKLNITCYEIERFLANELSKHLGTIEERARATGHTVSSEVLIQDFIREASFAVSFRGPRFTHVILNPPYKKIGAASEYRTLLRKFGIESVNLYTSFLGLVVTLTEERGEIVAIVPRSFCNGLYFRPFRAWLLERVSIAHIHVFESRKKAFSSDDVLQENIIVRLTRDTRREPVTISWSQDPSMTDYQERIVSHDEVVKEGDKGQFIRIPTAHVETNDTLFAYTLAELGLDVATGPVVDFRVKDFWLDEPEKNSVPLLYAHHFSGGEVEWPRKHKKPNALRLTAETQKWLMPRGAYAIVKRFSAKEERRRIVAYAVEPQSLSYPYYGFENHLNVIHSHKQGIEADLAQGIALFLNSTLVDQHFRSFSGHTQVNATDLRQMRFPSKNMLLEFGKWAKRQSSLDQATIDHFVENFHGN
jgi:adenine-specific DNA-methyltransferase